MPLQSLFQNGLSLVDNFPDNFPLLVAKLKKNPTGVFKNVLL